MIKLHKGDRGRDKWKEFFHSRSLLSVLMLTLTFAIILGVLMIVATPKRHDLKVGDIAGTTITATKDIEDVIATEKLRQAAAASIVEGMTKLDSTISQSVDDQGAGAADLHDGAARGIPRRVHRHHPHALSDAHPLAGDRSARGAGDAGGDGGTHGHTRPHPVGQYRRPDRGKPAEGDRRCGGQAFGAEAHHRPDRRAADGGGIHL